MILIIKNIFTNKEVAYPLNKVEDFDAIFDIYPSMHEVALRSDSIKDAAYKIAKHINSGSRVSAYIHSGVIKSEPTEETTAPKDKLKIESIENLGTLIDVWTEKRKKEKIKTGRDTTYSPDPGRIREKELDEGPPVTFMDKIKQRIKDEN